jgi:hypothetical protein
MATPVIVISRCTMTLSPGNNPGYAYPLAILISIVLEIAVPKIINALSKCIVVAGLVVGLLTTSLCAHGFVVHQFTPLETLQCASEEVNVAIATNANLFKTKCVLIRQ